MAYQSDNKGELLNKRKQVKGLCECCGKRYIVTFTGQTLCMACLNYGE